MSKLVKSLIYLAAVALCIWVNCYLMLTFLDGNGLVRSGHAGMSLLYLPLTALVSLFQPYYYLSKIVKSDLKKKYYDLAAYVLISYSFLILIPIHKDIYKTIQMLAVLIPFVFAYAGNKIYVYFSDRGK